MPGLLAPLPGQHTHQWDESDPARAYGAGIYPGRSQFACGNLSPTTVPSSWGRDEDHEGDMQIKRASQVPSDPGCISTREEDNSKAGAHMLLCPPSTHGLASSLVWFSHMPASTFPASAQACYKLRLVPGAVPRQPFGCDHVDVGHII